MKWLENIYFCAIRGKVIFSKQDYEYIEERIRNEKARDKFLLSLEDEKRKSKGAKK